MDHTTPNRLMDYARGLLNEAERANAEAHLAACGECSRSVAFFRRVQESALQVSVPQGLVEAAKATFVTAQGRVPLLRRVLAELVPPDAWRWQLAGVRSVQPTAHRFMYRWRDYCMDLKLDQEPESASMSLLGQIANERTPNTPVADVPVTLTAGDRVIAETRCNALGEFCVDFLPVRGMRVSFDIEEAEVSIDVPLNKLKI